MKILKFKIDGMSCWGCSSWVAGSLEATKWIESAKVSHKTKWAEVEYNENIIWEKDIFELIRNKGYNPVYIK